MAALSSLCLSSNLKSSQRTAFLAKVIDWNSSGTTFLLEKPIVVVYREREREREREELRQKGSFDLFVRLYDGHGMRRHEMQNAVPT